MEIEVVVGDGATIGESPTWVPAENALYWIDVKKPALYRIDPGAEKSSLGLCRATSVRLPSLPTRLGPSSHCGRGFPSRLCVWIAHIACLGVLRLILPYGSTTPEALIDRRSGRMRRSSFQEDSLTFAVASGRPRSCP